MNMPRHIIAKPVQTAGVTSSNAGFSSAAIISFPSLLSVAFMISAVHFDAARAQKGRAAALACGKQLQQQCGGISVFGTNILECLKRDQEKLSK